MAIIIDVNCYHNVFSRTSSEHKKYKPVKDWIIKGKGLLVFGGTKYLKELGKLNKYSKLVWELKNSKKAVEGDLEVIDKFESKIKEIVSDKDFDDHHLWAIVMVTKCQLICTCDTRSCKFLKNSSFYPKGCIKPSYFTGKPKNKNLLDDKYVNSKYKPLSLINRKEQEKILNSLTK